MKWPHHALGQQIMLRKLSFVSCSYIHVIHFRHIRSLGLGHCTCIEPIRLGFKRCIFLLEPHLVNDFFYGRFLYFLFPEFPNALVFVVFGFISIVFCIFKRVVTIQRCHYVIKPFKHDFVLILLFIHRLIMILEIIHLNWCVRGRAFDIWKPQAYLFYSCLSCLKCEVRIEVFLSKPFLRLLWLIRIFQTTLCSLGILLHRIH